MAAVLEFVNFVFRLYIATLKFGRDVEHGVLESGITLPPGYLPDSSSTWEGVSCLRYSQPGSLHLINLSSLASTSPAAIPFSPVWKDWAWRREGCGQVAPSAASCRHGRCHPSQVGRPQHVPVETQRASPHYRFMHVWNLVWRPMIQSCLSVVQARPERKADANQHYSHTKQGAWTIVLVVGEEEPGRVGGRELPEQVSRHLWGDLPWPASISMSKGERHFHSKNRYLGKSGKLQKGKKLSMWNFLFVFLNKNLQIVKYTIGVYKLTWPVT